MNNLVDTDPRNLPEKLKYVGHIDHGHHIAIGTRHLRSGDNQGYPYTRLVHPGLGSRAIKGNFHSGSEGAVITNDDDRGVGSFGVVVKRAPS